MESPVNVIAKLAAVFSGSKKSEEDQVAACKAVEQLAAAAATLSAKAKGLQEKQPGLCSRIQDAADQLQGLQPDVSVVLAKVEQAVMQKITIVSSCCDTVLCGGDTKQLESQLAELEHLVRQRVKG